MPPAHKPYQELQRSLGERLSDKAKSLSKQAAKRKRRRMDLHVNHVCRKEKFARVSRNCGDATFFPRASVA